MVKIDNIINDFIMVDNPKNNKTNNNSFRLINNKLYSYGEIIAEKHDNEYKIYLKKAPFNYFSNTTSTHVNKVLNKCSNLNKSFINNDYVVYIKNNTY